MEPLEALRHIFGFEAFRGLQADVIADLMAGRDTAVVMPTGAGKSLCYQIPAICRPGCGIIVSPLIALMDDQVAALRQSGVRAATLNSQSDDADDTIDALRAGRLDLLYVAPERAATPGFRRLVGEASISLLAIDEAHCVSQWGHDFRPDYRRLRPLADALGAPRIALTATADAATRADICSELGIPPDRLHLGGFDRPNIGYQAAPRTDGTAQLIAFVRDQGAVAGIVYAPTRKGAEAAHAALAARGVPAFLYHAGLDADARRAAQRAFMRAEHGVMCATVAFGMGIDKPDIRFVVHMGLPGSIEAYYQESGRAGRDGQPAIAQLFWSAADVALARRRILSADISNARRAHELRMLDALARWAATTGCRRVPLLAHFGEADPRPCGNCDTCLDPPALVDVRVPAQKLLSAAVRTGQRYGLAHLARVLRGEADDRIEALGHDRLSVWGIGADVSTRQWMTLGRLLEAEEALVRDSVHGGLALGPAARARLAGREAFPVRQDEWEPRQRTRQVGARARPDGAESPLLSALKAWRRDEARARNLPAYVIFHDATLAAIADARPADLAQLGRIPGVGDAKLARHGDAILGILGRPNAAAPGTPSA